MQIEYDLVTHLHNQKEFSWKTFGPHNNTEGIIDHIKKELKEIEACPSDIFEWIDVVILALDGALRNGYTPEEIVTALKNKLIQNTLRKWPDWRTATPGKAIEHIKE